MCLDSYLEVCLLRTHISDYPNICNGKTRIPGVNDGEEFELVHVSDPVARRWQKYANRFNPSVNISKMFLILLDLSIQNNWI